MGSRKRFLSIVFLMLVCIWMVPGVSAKAAGSTSSAKHEFQSFELAKDYLKQMMIKREEKIEFTLNSSSSQGNKLMEELIDAVSEVDSTTRGREGDYLAIHVERYELTCDSTPVYGGKGLVSYYEHHFTYLINYYTTWDQEKEMTYRISQVLADLKLDDKTDYEKIKAIYSYVCSNVSYDYGDDDGRFSAYNALVRRSAVCQGYASLIYRLMREAGIECRIITGSGSGVAHSWNIVKIGTKFYNIDATWDAGRDSDKYKWFLKTDAEFKKHVRDQKYKTASFYKAYPMSTEAYCFDNHTWAEEYTVDVAATCSSYGIKSIHCVKCNEVKPGSLKQVAMKPHAYGSWTILKKATVFSKGKKSKTCSVCGYEKVVTIKKLKAKAELNAVSVRMKVGQVSEALTVSSMSEGDSIVKWKSSNSKIVYVNKRTGKLKARKKGTAVITVTLKSGATATCKVKVTKKSVKATALVYKAKRKRLTVGQTFKPTLLVTPITTTDEILYQVSDETILQVSQDGELTALKKGTAYVIASISGGLTAKCKIIVK